MKLPPELRYIYAMLRRFPLADKDYRNIPPITFLQNGILIDIHFAQNRAELAENRNDGRFCFLAKKAAGTRVQGDVPGPRYAAAKIFRMPAHGSEEKDAS